MRFFGLEITRARTREKALQSVSDNRGGWQRVFESYPGAWQQNVEIDRSTVLSHYAVYSCMTLIASDIAKLRVKLVALDSDGVWSEIKNPAYDPVLRKPNHYQNRIQFWEYWMLSKLSRGNTYALKQRDNRGVVRALYILDPCRVKPLVADSGDVLYELGADDLSKVDGTITVPAREIIHDRMNTIFHPLVGTSPIMASGLAAMQGSNIQNNSTRFFANAAMPSGFLTAPGQIDNTTAQRLKDQWEQNYGGVNRGKIAVLGDGLKFEPMTMTFVDAQLIEQLKLSAETVCSAFHVPPYKIGVGPLPSYNNVQALNVEYYSQCLQKHIEDAELSLDEGLEFRPDIGTEFDLDNLLRMDSVTQMDVLEKSKSVMTLDERRKKLSLVPITGGDTVYLQQQDHSIEAIAARDKLLIEQANNPQPQPGSPPQPPPPPDDDDQEEDDEFDERMFHALIRKGVDLHATS